MKFAKMTEITQDQLNAECKELFRYGQITSDINDLSDGVSIHRLTTFNYDDKKYYCHMVDGECTEVFEI